ncbi:hypothetical protein CYLTODRAFT_422633 [Cylindrobasidium torrendii FP15055 ss-10]|uniref:MFS general substrate transporter n=1 Tax=Cylindrobasidium torrendii FP15055 ss-10 TaxID=1314674 RepID=A0A0D7B9V9_9AGAR|nr:hypothetical protein CYLTODRAFT_422633 [Cylindrobasidium torrendii FP15055 ss-10]
MLETIAALVAFPSLSVFTWKLLEPAMDLNNAQVPACTPSSQYYMPITSGALPGFDATLCNIVTIFHLLLDVDGPRKFTGYFLGTCIPPFIVFMCFESSRNGYRFFGSFAQLFFGIIAQFVTIAAISPWYLLAFAIYNRKNTAPISQAHAQSSVFGTSIGWVIPTIMMVNKDTVDGGVTAIFQFAPLLTFLGQTAHQLVRPPPKAEWKSGNAIVVGTYILIFIAASSYHFAFLYELGTVEAIRELFGIDFGFTTAAGGSLLLFQVDFYMSSAAYLLSTLWFAESVAQVVMLAAWALIGSVIVGPGAAFAASALWRETKLGKRRAKAARAEAAKKDVKKSL